jgi:hypothetical protein
LLVGAEYLARLQLEVFMLALFVAQTRSSRCLKYLLADPIYRFARLCVMRFGRKLHQYQVPAWADFYIHYDRLKGLVKDGKVTGGIPLSSPDHSLR